MKLPPAKLAGGPLIMGVLNVTPDSFSDGGAWVAPEKACAHALAMLEAGADLIDIGGESTRPGAAPVPIAEEIARTAPIVAAISARCDAPISIDTMKPEVARAAFDSGATIWNDVTALRFSPASLRTAAALGASVVLMHMQGEPRTMQDAPRYEDVVAEVIGFLRERIEAADAAGVRDLFVDPGIGFGKDLSHNLALIRALPRIAEETGRPLLFGASRKSFIAKVAPSTTDARLAGSIAAALAASARGASVLRVHDVAETVQALKVHRAIEGGA